VSQSIALQPSLKLFKIISDETRLKILMILKRSEFTVGELVQLLEIHQSNASRHLSQLREGALVEDRREGALVYYRWSEALRNSKTITNMLKEAWSVLPEREPLEEMINRTLTSRRRKSQDFFNKVAGRYRMIARPGGGAEALVHALISLLNTGTCVDIGAGEGDLSLLFSQGCEKVIAIDLSQKMLDVLAKRCQESDIQNVEVRQGDLENIPVEDSSADLALLSQVLHHAPAPEKAFPEIARILKPGGTFIVLDLAAHDQEWTREQLGDHWLGFDHTRIETWIEEAGLKLQNHAIIPVEDGLPVIFFSGKK